MLQIIIILAILLAINIFLLRFSCNSCGKIDNKKQKAHIQAHEIKKQSLEEQVDF